MADYWAGAEANRQFTNQHRIAPPSNHDKTAEAVAEAHAACEEAVSSEQDERADQLNRWHADDHTDAASRGDAFVR